MNQNENTDFPKTRIGIMSLSQCLGEISLKCWSITDEKIQKEIIDGFNEIKEKSKNLYSIVQERCKSCSNELRKFIPFALILFCTSTLISIATFICAILNLY